ncbi:MAG: hypothetical protein RL264_1465 [Bacteroidota bacterium]|jgi:acyl-homoserine-lactone acylase
MLLNPTINTNLRQVVFTQQPLKINYLKKKSTFKRLLIFLFFSNLQLFSSITFGQVDYAKNVTIVRDSFGVPHIYGKTDADAAYGLAWAHAEDDFESIQNNLLPNRGLAGKVLGKEGLLFDFFFKFLDLNRRVDSLLKIQPLSSDYRELLKGYVAGVNAYAEKHQNEILHPDLFPVREEDVIKGYSLKLCLMAGMGLAIKATKEDKIDQFFSVNDTKGSNAFAVSRERMENDKTLLVVNSHQPIEGGFAWYEAHVNSEEGWNFIGGLFPGGVTPFVGSNENLGWAHTINYHTFGDIYKMKVRGKKYLLDGKWKKFQIRREKLKIRFGTFTLGIKKKFYDSEFGPVFKTKHGMYSFRFPVYDDIRAGEQWFRMNKATNFKEFENALKMEALPLFNVVYADKENNILLHSGGQIPDRNPLLNWKLPLDGTNSAFKWNKLISYERKPNVLNPSCGYVFNANNSPLICSGKECNYNDYFVGLQLFNFNRGELFDRYFELKKGKFSDDFIRQVKYDKRFNRTGSYMANLGILYNLNPEKYPKIKTSIQTLKRWDFEADAADTNATIVLVTHKMLQKKLSSSLGLLMIQKEPVSEKDAVWAITAAQKFLIKTHGSIHVPLGEVQRHIRDTVNLPTEGMSEQIRATESSLYDKKKGIYRINGGDGYIQFVRYSPEGTTIETINAYGASAKSTSPHYTDQMELFVDQKMRPMSFIRETVFKSAVRIYAPR